jgi:hypothetical protein
MNNAFGGGAAELNGTFQQIHLSLHLRALQACNAA